MAYAAATELYGRAHELSRLRQLLDDARAGTGGALAFTGEPGIGRTALLDAARRMGRDLLVLDVAGTPAEADLAHAGLGRLLRPVLEHLDELPPPQRAAVRAALALGPPAAGDRLAVQAGTLTLLQAVARDRPVLILADDLHWLDAPTAEALAFCARRPPPVGLALVLAARHDPRGVLRSVDVHEIRPVNEAAALAILSDAPFGLDVMPPVARVLIAAAAGNPLALRELPGLLEPGQREGSRPLPEPIHPGPQVIRAHRDVLEGLPDAARTAALVVACSRDQALSTIVPALRETGVGPADLEDAEDAGVLTIDAERVTFRHPLLRGVVTALASGSERRRAHAALARSIDPSHEPERWVRHRAEAVIGPDEAVAAALGEVAAVEAARAAFASSAATFLRAAQLSAAVDGRAGRLVSASVAAFSAGRTGWAADLARQALALRPSEALATEAALLVGRALITSGDLRETAAFLLAAAPASPDPAARTQMLALASFARLMCDDPYGALGVARRALTAAEEAGTPAARAQAWAALSVSSVLSGRVRVMRDVRPRLEADAERVAPDPGSATALCTIALGLAWAEEWEAARRLIHRVVSGLRSAGVSGALVVPLSHAAQIDYRTGEWTSAAARCDEAAALGEDAGQVVATAFTLAYRALLHASCGRDHACRTDAVHARNLAWGMGASAVDIHVIHALGLLELGNGNAADARDHLASLDGRPSGYGIGEPLVIPWRSDLIEALVRLGDTREATRHLVVLAADAGRAGGPAARALAARCRGLIARGPDHEAHFREALALHARSPTPFDQARTALLYGERLRRERRRADARVQLHAALEVFARLGADCWVARAREELDASGFRSRRDVAGMSRLTPREHQVATTVAGGSTNREAAARLFLSEKTVERHLGNVYRKLGLRSRSQLARWFASEERVGAEDLSEP